MSRGPDGRFPKNHSGNPKGRPRKPKPEAPDGSELLAKRFAVEIDGVQRELTPEEALQFKTFNAAIAGDRQAMREVARWIKKRDAYRDKDGPDPTLVPAQITRFSSDPDNVDAAMRLLGIASFEPMFAFASGGGAEILKLEAWAAQTAMARADAPELTDDDLNLLRNVTRGANQVRWR